MSSATTQNFRDQASDMADRTTHRINDAANAASSAVRDASRKVSSTMGDISDRANAASSDLSHRVEQQPLTSVLIAAGAGLLVGILLARR